MRQSVASLRRQWSHLPGPALAEVLHETVGDLAASFVAPLTRLAPRGLALLGLRRWHGKRFRRAGAGVEGANLVRRDGRLVETLPMTLTDGVSLSDGRPALVISYAGNAPRPWRWVRDELRIAPDGRLVAMTYVDLPLLRSLGGTPFLLTPEGGPAE